MKTRSANAFQFLEPREALDMEKLHAAIREDARALGPWLGQMNENQRIRDCIWAGQAPDGRKRQEYLGREPDTWEGASDAKIFAADEAINECKQVMTAARRAARLEVKGRNSNQDSNASLITPVVNYVMGTQMRDEVPTQSELWADFALEHGIGFLHVGWLTARELEERTVSVEDLLGLAMQMQGEDAETMRQGDSEMMAASPPDPMIEAQMEAELWDLILDETRRAQLIDLLVGYDKDMTKAEAGRVTAQLMRGEEAVYFAPYVRESRPSWEALCLGSDITLSPASLIDIQKAPRVTRWHWWTEAQLYDCATLWGWDMELVKIVAKHPGPMWEDWQSINEGIMWAGSTLGSGAAWTSEDAKTARLYHIAETYQRCPTKAGPSALFRTFHHGSLPKQALKHEVVKDKHGRIPIITLQREVKGKMMLSSRGIPQVAQGWQNSLKLHHDGLDDATDLRTRPPVNVPMQRYGDNKGHKGPLPFGPWKQLPFGKNEKDGFSFLELQSDPKSSIEVQQSLRSQMRRYFGLADETVPAPVTQMNQQALASRFMQALGAAIDMTMQLCQQYMDPIKGAQVAGMLVPLNATREEIQGEYQFDLSFDVKELDMDFLTKKFQLLSEMLQFDVDGSVPRGELMSYVFAAADPVLAQRLKIDPQGGANAAMTDEKAVISEQVAGHRITDRYNSPGARLQVHWDWVRNPEVMQSLAGRRSLLMVEIARAEQLEMQLEQQTSNKTTGRTGAPSEAPWEEGGKYSDWLKTTFGIEQPSAPPGNVVPMSAAA